MDNIFLSNESYETLQKLANSSVDTSSTAFSDSCINQLLEYGLIENHVIDYDLTTDVATPVFSEYSVTEKGIGYLSVRQTQEENKSQWGYSERNNRNRKRDKGWEWQKCLGIDVRGVKWISQCFQLSAESTAKQLHIVLIH